MLPSISVKNAHAHVLLRAPRVGDVVKQCGGHLWTRADDPVPGQTHRLHDAIIDHHERNPRQELQRGRSLRFMVVRDARRSQVHDAVADGGRGTPVSHLVCQLFCSGALVFLVRGRVLLRFSLAFVPLLFLDFLLLLVFLSFLFYCPTGILYSRQRLPRILSVVCSE